MIRPRPAAGSGSWIGPERPVTDIEGERATPRTLLTRLGLFLILLLCDALPQASGMMQAAAALAADAALPAAAPVAAEEEIQVEPVAVSPEPPPVPTNVKVMTLKEGVYLSWDEAPLNAAVHYNVYRSLAPGSGYRLVNVKPLGSPSFLDGPGNSLEPPENGQLYFYVVATVDAQGNISPYSDEMSVEPSGMVATQEGAGAGTAEATGSPQASEAGKEEGKVIEVPRERVVNLKLPAESQLSIQGYKLVEVRFTRQKYFRKDVGGFKAVNTTNEINQRLTVALDGKIGNNVDVHVNYTDENRSGGLDQSKQEISIVYHGDEDSAIQEIAFGDLQLSLPNTEFAGFSKQLFGIQGRAKLDRLKLTALFAQTKGITESKVFRGNYVQNDRTLTDTEYLRGRYYIITKGTQAITVGGQVVNQALPQNGTEQIWVDDGNSTNNTGGSNFRGPNNNYELYLPGRDYTLDYSTGVITFQRTLSSNHRVVVGYVDRLGNPVGFDGSGEVDLVGGLAVPPTGVISNAAHLMKDNVNSSDVSPLYLVNYYDLGRDKIIPPEQDPEFLFEVVNQGTNTVSQSGQGDASASKPWSFRFDTDFNLLVVEDRTNTGYPERAFANPGGGTATNEVYSQYSPSSSYRMHLKYKTRVDFYRLDRFNIIRGSETVFVDGRRLRRDADYFFDYTSGFLDFQDPTLLRPDSEIVVTYEYSPFGSAFQSNVFGARAEYDVTDHLFLGSTYLYNGTQKPLDIPSLGSSPNSLNLVDADARYDLKRHMIRSVTGLVPGLGSWMPPLDVKLTGEVARSSFNTDSFESKDEGETGTAMVDSMEGTDEASGASIMETRWVVSSPPQPVSSLGGLDYYAGTGATNNRVRFRNGATIFGRNNINGGHVYETTHREEDRTDILQVPYQRLTDQRWAGVRQVLSSTGLDVSTSKYLEAWIYNDGNDKWIMVDVGTISEDVNANNTLSILAGDREEDPAFPTEGDTGILTYYFDNLAGTRGEADETMSQEGRGNLLFDTEDNNDNGFLDTTDAYFQWGFRANWTGWRLVKIPVNFTEAVGAKTTSDGLSYFFYRYSTPNPQSVRVLRLWMSGASTAEINGAIFVENVDLTRNRWELSVDPDVVGASVNTEKLNVASISRDQDARYDPTLRFIRIEQGQSTDSILSTEKSLKLTYNLSLADREPAGDLSGRPVYLVTRRFGAPMDFSDFQELRFDLNVRTFQPGEMLFVRLENDSRNYYQYNVPLTSEYQNVWRTVVLSLNGAGGNRSRTGRPFINRTSQISVGIVSPNAPSAVLKELWINNLRVASAEKRTGLARRFNTTTTLGNNFATVNTRYREVDGGFSQIDQTSTRFQHSKQTGADMSLTSLKLFSQPVNAQLSVSRDERYTEQQLLEHPFYANLDNYQRRNTLATVSYNRQLPGGLGRLTNLRLSGNDTKESSSYLADYLAQSGVQGNSRKNQRQFAVNTLYDSPSKVFFLKVGSNQFTQGYTSTRDVQEFEFDRIPDFDRSTRVQTYGWTNNTEVVKNLTFTPGYQWSLTEAKGNTNFAGQAGRTEEYIPFNKRIQPKMGVVFRGIPGFIPQADYTGSNERDFTSYGGARFSSSNSLNLSASVVPGNWVPFFQKINLTLDGGRTESGTATVQNFERKRPLTLREKWWLKPPEGIAFSSVQSLSHRVNGNFRIFQFWDFRPRANWNRSLNVMSEGSRPTRQEGRTLELESTWNRRILGVPFVRFHLNSLTFNFNRTDNTQFDSSLPPRVDSDSEVNTYTLSTPYDINEKGQGEVRYQRILGLNDTRGVGTQENSTSASIRYVQRFLQNKVIRIPILGWKLRFEQALEWTMILGSERIRKDSAYEFYRVRTDHYFGTTQLKYNAFKNILVSFDFTRETNLNLLDPKWSYNQWRGALSLEARF